jgi:hypothetical protein
LGDEEPPNCQFTLMAWDTAFEKTIRADYSAMYALWGVFYHQTTMEYLRQILFCLTLFEIEWSFLHLKRVAIRALPGVEPQIQ